MDGPRLWDRRVRAEALRGYPLEDVVRRLGYRRDPTDAARWRRPGSVISINGFMFYEHLRGEGGGGAIESEWWSTRTTNSCPGIVKDLFGAESLARRGGNSAESVQASSM